MADPIPTAVKHELERIERKVDAIDRRVKEQEASQNRVRSDVQGEIKGMLAGIQAHVDTSMRAAMAPMADGLKKLDQIAEDSAQARAKATEIQEDSLRYRAEREARERLKEELNLTKVATETALMPSESKWRRLAPVLALIGVLVTALVGLVVAAVFSHR